MKKSVLLITEHYRAEQDTTGYLLEKLINALEKDSNINLTLLVKKDPNIAEQDNIYYVNAGEKNKSNLIKRLIYETKLAFGFLFKTWTLAKKEQIVFTGTTPIFLLIVIAFLKKIIGFKWLLLVHDIFPENLVPAKILQPNHILYLLSKKIFDYIYAQPEQVIVIGKDMKELVIQKTHTSNSNHIHIIQNWIDTSDIAVEAKNDNRIMQDLQWNNDNKIVFQYFGNMGRMQGLDNIIDAIGQMQYAHLAYFIFIGDGAYKEHIKKRIESLQQENVVYYGSVSSTDKSIGLNAGDIALVTLTDGMLGLGVPSKSYFSMAANKPLLAIMHQDSEIVDMIKNHNIGWHVEAENPQLLAKKLDEIVLVNEKEQLLFNSPRKILEEFYSEKVAMEKVINIIYNI